MLLGFGYRSHAIETGVMNCPVCRTATPYLVVELRRTFGFLGIPVFRTGAPRRELSCGSCTSTFPETLLPSVKHEHGIVHRFFMPQAADALAGERVLAQWPIDSFWYPAKVLRRSEHGIMVSFDDGDSATVRPDQIAPLDLKAGDRIFARWSGGGEWFPGTVASVEGDQVNVNYDDGDFETTTLQMVRTLRKAG